MGFMGSYQEFDAPIRSSEQMMLWRMWTTMFINEQTSDLLCMIAD